MGGRGTSSYSSSPNSALSDSQIKVIEEYVSGNGMDLNNILRDPEQFGGLQGDEIERANLLDESLTKAVPKTLYRSVDASALFGTNFDFANFESALLLGAKNKYAQSALDIANSKIGKKITNVGYMSTTRSSQIAENWGGFSGASYPVVMKITTNKNTKGLDVSNLSEGIRRAERSDPQKETLLARGQKYSIEKIYTKNGSIYIDTKMR